MHEGLFFKALTLYLAVWVQAWPGTLHCGLGPDTFISESLRPINGVLSNLMLEVTLQWANIPFQRGVEILLFASCSWNRDKLWPGGPLGSYAGIALTCLWNNALCVFISNAFDIWCVLNSLPCWGLLRKNAFHIEQHSYHINTLFDAFFQKRYDNAEDSSGEESKKEVCTAGLDLTELLL